MRDFLERYELVLEYSHNNRIYYDKKKLLDDFLYLIINGYEYKGDIFLITKKTFH